MYVKRERDTMLSSPQTGWEFEVGSDSVLSQCECIATLWEPDRSQGERALGRQHEGDHLLRLAGEPAEAFLIRFLI